MDADKHKAYEFPPDSTWMLSGEPEGIYRLLGSDTETSILRDFRWNLGPDTALSTQIEPYLVGNTLVGSASTCGGGLTVEQVGDVSTLNPSVSSSISDDLPEKSSISECSAEKPASETT
jgi:hypothetical protein